MTAKTDWLIAVENFISNGDYKSARGAAREIFELAPKEPDGLLVMAESELLLQDIEAAEYYLEQAVSLKKAKFDRLCAVRYALVKAGLFSAKFMPVSSVRAYEKYIASDVFVSDKNKLQSDDKLTKIYLFILERLFCVAASNYALLGEAEKCKKTLSLASKLSYANARRLYSNYLFFTNYRSLTSSEAKRLISRYQNVEKDEMPREALYRKKTSSDGKYRVGFISGVFREHSTLPFLPALLFNPAPEKFEVYVYNLGREDAYSRKLREFNLHWRNLSSLSPRDAALKIAEDSLDALVDLAGHAEGSVLDVLMYRPAYLQITAVGYFASTGSKAIDYVLTDDILTPLKKSERFIEECARLKNHSAFCYWPTELWGETIFEESPSFPTVSAAELPFKENLYPTFYCPQNLLKLSDDLLLLWRKVFDKLTDFRLILQNKTCSTAEGKNALQARLKNLGYKLSQVELLPYSKDYKQNFAKVDIMLDTTPYPGGVTTCDALFAGVPVITLKGNDPWSRLGASILNAAGLNGLIAETPKEYAEIMYALGRHPSEVIKHKEMLRDGLCASGLMDYKGYGIEFYGLIKKLILGS